MCADRGESLWPLRDLDGVYSIALYGMRLEDFVPPTMTSSRGVIPRASTGMSSLRVSFLLTRSGIASLLRKEALAQVCSNSIHRASPVKNGR